MEPVFSEAERRAWCPPERLTAAEWAERYRVLLASADCAEPGPYRISRTPYVRGILDAVVDPSVEEIVALKATQIGWSETIRNVLGYWVDHDPGPCLFVMPNEQSAREIVDGKIIPLVEETEVLRRHLTENPHDVTKGGIQFDTMRLYIGWSGSAQTLRGRTCRYVLFDEADAASRFSGHDADPVSLARERTKTFLHRRKILLGSTPTTRQGHIWRAWEGCTDKRTYHVPCPFCRFYQPLVFTQVKWSKLAEPDRNKEADEVELKRLGYYECIRCKQTIEDRHKPKMLLDGVWLSEGQSFENGIVIGAKPVTRRVGFHFTTILSPWTSFSAVAAEHLRSIGDIGKQMNFRNNWLAEPFEEQVTSIKVGALRERKKDAPKPDVVPKWAGALVTSVDVHKEINGYYWAVRAWGADAKSQLIHIGVSFDLDEVLKLGLNIPYQLDGGGSVFPQLLVIDAGYRRDEIYQFATRDSRIAAIKGASGNQSAPIKLSDAGKEYGIVLRIIDTDYYKDRLAFLRNDPNRWLINSAVTDEYLMHQAGEHKIVANAKSRELKWEKVTSHAAVHFWDVEVYNVVGADILHANLIPDEAELVAMREMERQQAEQIAARPEKKKGWLGNTSNWLGGVTN